MLNAIEKDKEFQEKLEELDALMNYFQQKFKDLNKEQQECDKIINDLYHHIELSDLSGPELMRDVIMLRDTLRRRRVTKECGPLAAGLLPRLQSVRDIIRRIMGITYHYNPRILQGLDYGKKKKEVA